MFIDEAEIMVKGGHGGAGKVAFFRNRKGASGGNGGSGGGVYAIATSNLTHLKPFTEVIKYIAENGGPGGPNKRTGLNGKDLYLKMPVGTTIIDITTNQEITIDEKSPKYLLCKGGIGGLGNVAFKTSTNRTPKNAEPGREGQERKFKLILRLIANFGLIGLPNAGKSSLLNKLTAANVRTADYPFTTLEPNLGSYYGLILADIPGLIEGASKGKGLGIKFLQHIERTKILFHFVSADSENIEDDYQKIRNELEIYNPELTTKKEYLIVTKTDMVDAKQLAKVLKQAKKIFKNSRKEY